MKGLAFRKLSRTSSHRQALLRNLVTSLIQHERISTTVAKAKEAQRMAEKIVTKAKRALVDGKVQQQARARAFVYDDIATMPLLRSLAERYINRPGGYTRLHLHGNRKGDNAPRALLEFVDRPEGDLKLEMTAMSIGREMYLHASKRGESALTEQLAVVGSQPLELDERFHPLTRTNAEKCIQFRGQEARDLLLQKARDHFFRIAATREIEGDRRINYVAHTNLGQHGPRGFHELTTKKGAKRATNFTPSMTGQRRLAGMQRNLLKSGPREPEASRPGKKNSVVRISKGAFASRRQKLRVSMPPSGSMAAWSGAISSGKSA